MTCRQTVEYAKGLPGVVHAAEETFACSVDSVGHIIETIEKKGLNRVVVAACTPRTHEPVFQNALREAGLNPYLFEFANIREQCSLVHMADKDRATREGKRPPPNGRRTGDVSWSPSIASPTGSPGPP